MRSCSQGVLSEKFSLRSERIADSVPIRIWAIDTGYRAGYRLIYWNRLKC